MRIIAQRVKEASVSVDGRLVAAIDAGIMALVGFGQEDGPDYRSSPSYTAMARKLVGLRIFPGTGENAHKFHLSLDEFGGQLLLVPQFTLFADCHKGRRPSFTDAGDPAWARDMFTDFVQMVDETYGVSVSSGNRRAWRQSSLPSRWRRESRCAAGR